jgi:hypothetical protein
MDYFVSADNAPHHQWQMELLIESFRRHKLEDKLCVGLAESPAPANANFCRNLYEHKRLLAHENIGGVRGYSPLNGLYSVMWAQQYNHVTQPLVVLERDLVLFRPPELLVGGYPEITFAPWPFFTPESAAEAVGPFWEWLGHRKEDYTLRWLPVGSVMVFANVPVFVFERTIVLAELLAVQQLVHGRETIWEHTDKLAWAVNLADFVGQIMIRGDYSLTMPVLAGGDSPFIDYETGLPPTFHKSMFAYPPPSYVAFGDPFEILADSAISPNAHFLADLARANLDSRKRQEVE